MINVPESALPFGFSNALLGAFTSRTIMLNEVRLLFAACPQSAELTDYRAAIIDQNALLKPTRDTRLKTFAFLRDRYGLDPSLRIFRLARELWGDDEEAQPLLTLLAATARDPLLRATADLVLQAPEGVTIFADLFADAIDASFAGRFNDKTLIETARRAASSWEQSGHLVGKVRKMRLRANCRPVAVAYGLLLGHLCGVRGEGLFTSFWARLLDAPTHVLREQAAEASRRGWIEYRSAGGVTEVGFRHLLRGEEVDA